MNNPNEKAIAALATDAPIVEGLDEALECVFEHEHDAFKQKYGRYPHAVTNEAARLYAQGRTQSADVNDINVVDIPDGWKLVPIEPTDDMQNAFVAEHETWNDPTDYGFISPAYKAMLSAAPPVTGGDLTPESEGIAGKGDYDERLHKIVMKYCANTMSMEECRNMEIEILSNLTRPQEIDIEALKRVYPPRINLVQHQHRNYYEYGVVDGWNACVDHLAAAGYLSKAKE